MAVGIKFVISVLELWNVRLGMVKKQLLDLDF